ncbi:MAG TPA: DUF4198 domain-containing protein [Cyclobacteriaceae bacterium]
MKRIVVTSIVCLVGALVSAHEFWLQPKKYKYNVGEEMKVDFMVGEGFTGELWDLAVHKVEKSEMHFAGGFADLTKQVKPTRGNNLSYKFLKEGTHLLTLQSNAAYIESEGAEFNEYLKEDGLDNITELRTKNGELNKSSKEFYQRFAKVLVQSGSKTDNTFSKRVNFPVEIVPMSNPYALKSGDYLECRVFFQNRPSAHQLVKVWSHVVNRIFLHNIYTEDDGTLKFPISNSGPWMVSTVKMIPSDKEGADYKSMWASLVFGIE